MKLGNLVYLNLGENDSIAVVLANEVDSDHILAFDLIDNEVKLLQRQDCYDCGNIVPSEEIKQFIELVEDIEEYEYFHKSLWENVINLYNISTSSRKKWEGYESIFDLSDL